MRNLRWQPRNGCDGRIMVIMTIQDLNLVPNPPELSLLKFLLLAYHHSYFLAATLDFTSFLGGAHFFAARLFWIRFFI